MPESDSMTEKLNIIVTGAGGGGGNNLINSIKHSGLNCHIIGTNCDSYSLAKSNADISYFMPPAGSRDFGEEFAGETRERYLTSLKELIAKENIDLIIPNNDREIKAISELRDEIDCRVFLPDPKAIDFAQDKFEMYKLFLDYDIPMAGSYDLKSYDDVDNAFNNLPPADKYWVRMRKGSGSKGATWVKTPDQAKNWIQLWEDLRGYPVEAFTISEFLPGRDYAFQSVWKDGKPIVMKIVERLSYFFGSLRLSGMSSTPQVAKTVNDPETLKTILKAISVISEKPHGNYCMDLKGDAKGRMCVTEFNIGRFCMITPIFDFSGKLNTAEAYIRCAMDLPIEPIEGLDYEEGKYMIRELDTLPTICTQKEIDRYL